MTADYTYFPYARTALSSAVTTADTPAADPFVKLSVGAVVNGTASGTVDLRLAGPGEIRGLDRRVVLRTDPVDGALGVPPELFAAVELRPADLPWMFTPVGPSGAQLRPWLCLVVTDIEETGEPVVDATKPLPVLHVPDVVKMLPNPAEAWAWAHVAAVGEPTSLEALVTSNSTQVVARLVCPRLLDPERRYIASIVPLFEGGRIAGLGGTPPEGPNDRLQNAWTTGAQDLPVYFSWQFHTGVGGDFRSLAQRLKGRPLPDGAGTRTMDISAPGGVLNLAANATTKSLGLEAALKPDHFCPTDWDPTEQARFASRIASLIKTANTAPLSLGPPLWGRWPAAQLTVPGSGSSPAWLRQLNSDPRSRAAAGFGARVVQQLREQLLAEAWRQVGDVERANQRLRQAQLARAHSRSIYVGGMPALGNGSFLQLTRPLHDRVLVGARSTAYAEVSDSAVPERLFDGALRRLARPRGPVGRRLGLVAGAVIEKASAGQISAVQPPYATKGAGVAVAQVERLPIGALQQRPGVAGFTPLVDWTKPQPVRHRDTGPDTALMAAFRAEIVSYESWKMGTRRPAKTLPLLDPGSLRTRIMDATDPDSTVPRRAQAVVTAPNWDGAGDPLEPIMAAPVIRRPMVEPLVAMSQELLLPGLESIPADTVTAAFPNPAFIAAYMVGLSHEFARELLFNEYPTDQRGTYFRQFWDTRGRVPAPAAGTTDDIPAIDGWSTGGDLGSDVTGGGSGLLVVIIRGELVRRYPDATLYLQAAKWKLPLSDATRELDDSGTTYYPQMRGRLEPDLVYFGVPLSKTDAVGPTTPTKADDPAGYFVVFEQHPVKPHYGIGDGGDIGQPPHTFDAVGRGNLTPPTAGATPPRFVPASQPLWWGTNWPAGPVWGSSSAAMAAITLQRPTRLALHASDLLGT